ncbi:MAG: DUF309 domain-containing protein [Bacteroidota bacterium]
MKRYCPYRKFPPYKYLPGKNPDPIRKGGYRESKKDPMATAITRNNYQDNENYRFAIDLTNYGYYWEAHLYYEALWNAHKRKGSIADFFKAMIKMVTSSFKEEAGKIESSGRLLEGTLSLLNSLPADFNLGINISELRNQLNTRDKIHIVFE